MAEQLFQVGIKAVATNQQGQVLLLHVPGRGGSVAYWDLPGGRMDPGETFLQTLQREIQEETGVIIENLESNAEHLATVMSNVTIPVGDGRVPLILMAYKVTLPDDALIQLDPESIEDEFEWCDPSVAAERLQFKYPLEFCTVIKEL